mgnify:CR=1 FL=1
MNNKVKPWSKVFVVVSLHEWDGGNPIHQVIVREYDENYNKILSTKNNWYYEWHETLEGAKNSVRQKLNEKRERIQEIEAWLEN